MTIETIVTVAVIAWALGLITLRDVVNGIKEIKAIRQDIATDSTKTVFDLWISCTCWFS